MSAADAVIGFTYNVVVSPFRAASWLLHLPLRLTSGREGAGPESEDSCPRFKDIPEEPETDKIDAAWPPAPHPVEALPVQALIRANGKLIRDLCYATTLSEEEAQMYLLPVIANLARIVHLTPASEYDHHQGYGGLFTHTLETAYYAANDAKTAIFDRSASPKDLHQNKRRWILTAVLAALTHDIGKPFTDMEITAPNGKHWAQDEPIVDWLRKNRIESYYIAFRPAREHNEHKSAALANSAMLIPKETLKFLGATGYGEQMMKEFRNAVLEGRNGGLIGRILDNADGLSRNVDGLRQRRIRPEFKNVAHPQGDQILKAMRVLIQNAKWTTNKDDKSRVFVTKQGCYLAWSEAVAEEVRQQALDMGFASLPADFLKLASILADAGAAVRSTDEVANTHQVFWRMTPIILGNVQFDCVRLADPQLIFDGAPPAQIEAIVEGLSVDETTKLAWIKCWKFLPVQRITREEEEAMGYTDDFISSLTEAAEESLREADELAAIAAEADGLIPDPAAPAVPPNSAGSADQTGSASVPDSNAESQHAPDSGKETGAEGGKASQESNPKPNPFAGAMPKMPQHSSPDDLSLAMEMGFAPDSDPETGPPAPPEIPVPPEPAEPPESELPEGTETPAAEAAPAPYPEQDMPGGLPDAAAPELGEADAFEAFAEPVTAEPSEPPSEAAGEDASQNPMPILSGGQRTLRTVPRDPADFADFDGIDEPDGTSGLPDSGPDAGEGVSPDSGTETGGPAESDSSEAPGALNAPDVPDMLGASDAEADGGAEAQAALEDSLLRQIEAQGSRPEELSRLFAAGMPSRKEGKDRKDKKDRKPKEKRGKTVPTGIFNMDRLMGAAKPSAASGAAGAVPGPQQADAAEAKEGAEEQDGGLAFLTASNSADSGLDASDAGEEGTGSTRPAAAQGSITGPVTGSAEMSVGSASPASGTEPQEERKRRIKPAYKSETETRPPQSPVSALESQGKGKQELNPGQVSGTETGRTGTALKPESELHSDSAADDAAESYLQPSESAPAPEIPKAKQGKPEMQEKPERQAKSAENRQRPEYDSAAVAPHASATETGEAEVFSESLPDSVLESENCEGSESAESAQHDGPSEPNESEPDEPAEGFMPDAAVSEPETQRPAYVFFNEPLDETGKPLLRDLRDHQDRRGREDAQSAGNGGEASPSFSGHFLPAGKDAGREQEGQVSADASGGASSKKTAGKGRRQNKAPARRSIDSDYQAAEEMAESMVSQLQRGCGIWLTDGVTTDPMTGFWCTGSSAFEAAMREGGIEPDFVEMAFEKMRSERTVPRIEWDQKGHRLLLISD